jgi:hypothetical protein
VVAVGRRLVDRERLRDRSDRRLQGVLHHDLAVFARETLRPVDRECVVVEVRGAFAEVGEVLGQVVGLLQPRMQLAEMLEVLVQAGPGALGGGRRGGPGALVAAAAWRAPKRATRKVG